jgi:plastocyanin
MNKDNRISNLPQTKRLLSDQVADPFPHKAEIAPPNNQDDEALFLLARSGSHNEKVKFKNLKKSVLDGSNAVFLTGKQLISGEKTFADVCTFESTVYINEIIDITQTGDISGNIFVGETGLFEKIGIGLDFTDRRVIKEVFIDFPKESNGYASYTYGGGIDPHIISEDIHKTYTLEEDGLSYLFSGDSTGLDPNIEIQVGDSLSITNLTKPHSLVIKDLNNNLLSSEISGITNYYASSTGNYYYQCRLPGHEGMSGSINIKDVDIYSYSLMSGAGNNYLFSGDASGINPNLLGTSGDIFNFANLTNGNPLVIKDENGNVQAQEASGKTSFKANSAGSFYYQSIESGSQSMSGSILVSSPLTKNYSLFDSSGESYLFSGDAQGLDPLIESREGDLLIFENLTKLTSLTIKDENHQVVAAETSGVVNFKGVSSGLFYYQSTAAGHQSLSGAVKVSSRKDPVVLDFSDQDQIKTTTSLKSYPIYEPSGFYNSNTPESQQNWGQDLSLDGHQLNPDDIHREMGGAWYQIDFDQAFHYKGFSLFRKDLENSAEDLKVVASNNGLDWNTIHRVSGLSPKNYEDKNSPTSFALEKYHPETYLKYRLVGEKMISGNLWEISHFNFSGLATFEHTRTVDPLYTLHVSGDSCFLGDITHTGNRRQEGNSYRIGESSLLGDFKITGSSWRYGDLYMKGDYYLTGDFTHTGNSFLYGDKTLIGDLTHTGYYRQFGELYRIGDSNLLGDFRITGDSWRYGDMRMKGDYHLTGDFTQTGDSMIYGDEKVTGDVYVGEYLYHYEDQDTFLRFRDDEITLQAGNECKILLSETEDDFISFDTSGIEQARLTNEGFLGVNTASPVGELSVTGSAYLERAFTTGEDGQWERVFGGSDEVVSFVAPLHEGKDSFHLDFPKTFGEKPAVTLSLENSAGGPIIPYMISGLNEFSFAVNFGTELKDDEYKLHINARPTGQSSANKTTTQSFTTDIPKDVDTYEVFYPCAFHAIPSISTAAESDSICVPYMISGVSRDSFYVLFSSPTKPGYRIHTHAVR